MTDNKKSKPFIIQNNNINLHAQWDGDTILFDTEEEAKEFIKTFPEFFKGEEYLIVEEEHNLSDIEHIYYKDLIKTEEYKESIKND